MPRKITVNEEPNPTGLTMHERQLCMDLLQSMEESVNKLREEEQVLRTQYAWGRPGSAQDWTAEDERMLRQKVYKSAYHQITGRQKTDSGYFTLITGTTVGDEDMAYIRESLGIS